MVDMVEPGCRCYPSRKSIWSSWRLKYSARTKRLQPRLSLAVSGWILPQPRNPEVSLESHWTSEIVASYFNLQVLQIFWNFQIWIRRIFGVSWFIILWRCLPCLPSVFPSTGHGKFDSHPRSCFSAKQRTKEHQVKHGEAGSGFISFVASCFWLSPAKWHPRPLLVEIPAHPLASAHAVRTCNAGVLFRGWRVHDATSYCLLNITQQ